MRGEGDKGKWDQMPKRRRHRALFKHEMNNKKSTKFGYIHSP